MGQHQKNIVRLTKEERAYLSKHTKNGDWSPREVTRAMILLLADANGPDHFQDKDICEVLGCSKSTVIARRKRFAETKNVELTIFDHPRSGRPTIVDGTVEAHITMLACSHPPEGRAQWSLNLIRNRVVTLEVIDQISAATVGRVLKKKKLSHG